MFKKFFALFTFFIILQSGVVSAQTCSSLFEATPKQIQSSQFHLGLEAASPAINVIESRLKVAHQLAEQMPEFSISQKTEPVMIAINLSTKNNLHVVSKGLDSKEHKALLDFINAKEIASTLNQVSPWLRNKYFEIEMSKSGSVSVEPKFPWELGVPVKSQLLSGFAQKTTATVRTVKESKVGDVVRKDLLRQRRSQETLATCGLSSLTQILQAHNIKMTENILMSLVEKLKIKTGAELFGENPGLTLEQLFHVTTELSKRYGFKLKMKTFTSEQDVQEFAEAAAAVAQNPQRDIVLNYHAPSIGRPGAGHFSPVGGYNSTTREILVSEVNLAANPSFWTSPEFLADAMKNQDPTQDKRGYIIIEWP